MIKQGMKLTGEQRGEVRQEAKLDGGSGEAAKLSDDKKSAMGNGDEKDLKACLWGQIHRFYLDSHSSIFWIVFPEFDTVFFSFCFRMSISKLTTLNY